MAVRRLARQGIPLAEVPPIASTSAARPARRSPASTACPACRHSSSASVPLHAAVAARSHHAADDSHAHHRQSAHQPTSSWAALSRAGQALFNSGPSDAPPAVADAASPALVGSAAELVQELKLAKPDPHRVWNLFSKVDLEGLTHTLPLISLHALLPAIHVKPHQSPKATARNPLTIQASTAAARAYAVKVDLIRLRLRQAGAKAGPGDWNALLWQYHALRYAPGATKVWDEMVEAGFVPQPAACARVFETMVGWIEMHGRAGGKAVERAAADPLLRKAVSILGDLAGDDKRTDAVLAPFFSIVAKARDPRVLATVFKDIYGLDVKLPGAIVELTGAQKAKVRPMGEAEVLWALEGLAELDDLSIMVAVFEIFDQPSRPPSSPDFFTTSFSTSPTSTAAERPHPIGTRAFTTLIQTASRLNAGAIARTYFDALFTRWATDAEFRIAELEKAVGSVVEPQGSEGAPPATESGSADLASDRAEKLAPLANAHLAASPGTPVRPYAVPSTLISNIAHYALHHYDLATARWIRLRTKRLLQLMESQTDRIAAVLSRLEPSKPRDSTSAAPTPAPRSLVLLEREHALLDYHRQQTRLMLSSVKASANVVRSSIDLHRLQHALGQRARRLADPKISRKELVRVRPGVRRKGQQVLLTRIVVLKHRLAKLYDEGYRPGQARFDRWADEIKELRKRADGQGLVVEGEGASEARSPSPIGGGADVAARG
ncbi:hypothetical protein JCM10212_003764 [Sporobolomyces blumeae]